MLTNQNVNYNQLIQFTANGIDIADFVQIRNALTKRFKDIYGSDIDLSTGTVDGQYIEMLSLIMNNILESIKQLYASIDVNQASGKFLDMLCALSNVVRKPATKSLASVVVKNIGNTDIKASTIQFVDKNSNTWTWTGNEMTFAANAESGTSLQVVCDTIGPISAPGDADTGKGWIDNTVQMYTFEVLQYDDAETGTLEETDSQLRARRSSSLALSGMTVLESLQAALISITGIDDAIIYSNATNANINSKDGSTILPHSVYVALRQKSNIIVNDIDIATIIYQKLTPGIGTSASAITSDARSINYEITDGMFQHISWKHATPVAPTITVTVKKLNYFSDNAYQNVATKIAEYCNNLKMSTDITTNEIWSEAVYADKLFRGLNTYVVTGITIADATLKNGQYVYTNQDTFYKYQGIAYDVTTSADTVTFKIK